MTELETLGTPTRRSEDVTADSAASRWNQFAGVRTRLRRNRTCAEAVLTHRRGSGWEPLRCWSYCELNGWTSGLAPEYSPEGFGYQSQTWRVIRFGCQKLNAAPELGAVFGHESCVCAGT